MKTLINENSKLDRKFTKLLFKMPPDRFFGVTTILGIKLSEEEKDRLGKIATKNHTPKEDINEESQIKEKNAVAAEDADTHNGEEEQSALTTIENSENEKDNEEVKENNDERDNDKEIEDILSLVIKTIDTFKELSLQRKKSLLKIMKAGV